MCDVPRCRGKTDDDGIIYYNHQVCGDCWERHCQGKINLKSLLKIKEARVEPPQTEVVSKQLILAYKGKGGDEQ